LKKTFYSMSEALGVNRLSASLHRHQPVILTFHGVTSDTSDTICNAEDLHLHRSIFERLMEHVARRYRPVPLARIVDWLEGRAGVPERSVAVTFDDGFRNVLTEGAPVLTRLGIPATLFVTTDFVFRGDMLWPDRLAAALALTREKRLEISAAGDARAFDLASRAGKLQAYSALGALCKSMGSPDRLALVARVIEGLGVDPAKLPSAWPEFRPLDPLELKLLPGAGITVGAHTCSHPILAMLPAAEQARELGESKRLIESVTGERCDQFAYPNGGRGDFSAHTRRAVVDAGYRCAVTTIKRRVVDGDDAFELPRCTLTHNRITMAEFSAELGGFPGVLRRLRPGAPPRGASDAPLRGAGDVQGAS
jgi:peptidoglycan/xylan/chitin deacetylase (PgdA/CDA1 family)